MEPVAAFKSCLRQYATFSGRAPRSEFWFFVLLKFISFYALWFVTGMVSMMVTSGRGISAPLPGHLPTFNSSSLYPQIPILAWMLVLLLPSIAVEVRRLHDINRSGWWYWLYLIPLVGLVLMLIWNCEHGTAGPNRYGRDPLMPGPWDGRRTPSAR